MLSDLQAPSKFGVLRGLRRAREPSFFQPRPSKPGIRIGRRTLCGSREQNGSSRTTKRAPDTNKLPDLHSTALNPFRSSFGDDSTQRVNPKKSSTPRTFWLNDLWGWLLYKYYNWRQDSYSDLQLFLALNAGLVLLGVAIKHNIIDNLDAGNPEKRSIWQDLYKVLTLVLGQDFPEVNANAINQAFSLLAAALGLVSFALVLALVEQIVLEVVETNVRTGSPIFEKDHMVILAWAKSQRDMEVLFKILSQACLAYRNDGGRVIVVLSQRSKLEMESSFRRSIPESERHKSQFVFRQGSPLIPDDLRNVGANDAAVVLIIADASRGPEEADAQTLRTAVLLDELDLASYELEGDMHRHGPIIAESKTTAALPLMSSYCSKRIVAVPTNQLNARRLARMVRHPVVAEVSKAMLSFNSPSQIYLHHFPELVGVAFGSLNWHFPNGLVLGLMHRRTGDCRIAPNHEEVVGPDDELVMMRPTSISEADYRPLMPAQAPASLRSWSPSEYHECSTTLDHGPPIAIRHYDPRVASRLPADMWRRGGSQDAHGETSPMYILPAEYLQDVEGGELLCSRCCCADGGRPPTCVTCCWSWTEGLQPWPGAVRSRCSAPTALRRSRPAWRRPSARASGTSACGLCRETPFASVSYPGWT